MLALRVYALALGYEDLTDHDQLREDALLAVLSGKQRAGEGPLAGKSTLNRLEPGGEAPGRYKKIQYRQEAIDELLVQVFLEAQPEVPEQIVRRPGDGRPAAARGTAGCPAAPLTEPDLRPRIRLFGSMSQTAGGPGESPHRSAVWLPRSRDL